VCEQSFNSFSKLDFLFGSPIRVGGFSDETLTSELTCVLK